MTFITVHEWGKIPLGTGAALTRAQADGLIAAARAHSLGGEEGTAILTDHHLHLRARQMVGVIATPGCVLEILPKIDPLAPDEARATVRERLVTMLNVALDLGLSPGEAASMARQNAHLLEILIRLFADRLLAETRRGLPRVYLAQEDDLPALRGRLDVVRQFSTHAVRPDRLACRFDALSADTPLMQVMKACVLALRRHARGLETQRRLDELRMVLADVGDVPLSALPWETVRIDRTSGRWKTLYALARLFLRREWQATHHQAAQANGITLLFPMNDLFETYIAALMRAAVRPMGLEVVAQGGLRYCLGDWPEDGPVRGTLFQTKPDILVKERGRIIAVIDTKWKKIAADPADRKHGVGQGDVYQMMAYAQLYDCPHLMLLYPHHAELGAAWETRRFGMALPGAFPARRLDVATVDVSAGTGAVRLTLAALLGHGHRLAWQE